MAGILLLSSDSAIQNCIGGRKPAQYRDGKVLANWRLPDFKPQNPEASV
jgi:hypothetical protein